MQKELFDEVIIDTDYEYPHKIKLTYYMIIDNVREEYCDLKVYGAEIVKVETANGKVLEKDDKLAKNLFFRYNEAEAFLKKLVRGCVTPVGLMPAISEHIKEQLCNFNY